MSNFDVSALITYAGVNNFIGVYPRDTMPNKIDPNVSLVCNLDVAKGEGTHWVAVYNDPKFDYVEYFDSYGKIPPKEIEKYMKSSRKPTVYSSNEIQSLSSFLCGYFCVYYIICRYRGVSAYDILYTFNNDNGKQNDETVIENLKKMLL